MPTRKSRKPCLKKSTRKSRKPCLKKSTRKSRKPCLKKSKRKSRKPCIYGVNKYGCCNKKPSVKKTKRCLSASIRRKSPCKYGEDVNGCCNKKPSKKYKSRCKLQKRSRSQKLYNKKSLFKKIIKSIRKSYKNKKPNCKYGVDKDGNCLLKPRKSVEETLSSEEKDRQYYNDIKNQDIIKKKEETLSSEEKDRQYYNDIKNQDIIKKKEDCEDLMCKYNITNDSTYKIFSKKYHPDKGGERDLWESVTECRNLGIFCPNNN